MKVLRTAAVILLPAVLATGVGLAAVGRSWSWSNLGFGAGEHYGAGSDLPGLMPEVVVRAEMPRLMMPTVEVRAYGPVAVSGHGPRLY